MRAQAEYRRATSREVPAAEWDALDPRAIRSCATRSSRRWRSPAASAADTRLGCRVISCCATTTAGWSARCPATCKLAFLGRVRLRLELGAVLRARRARLLPEAAVGRAVHARRPAPAAGRRPAPTRSVARRAGRAAARVAARLGASGVHVQFHDRRGPGGARAGRVPAAARLPVPVAQPRLPRLRGLPRRASRRTSARRRGASGAGSQEAGRRAAQRCRAPKSTPRCWRTIFGFSERTFLRHGNAHYLSPEFLERVAGRMPDTIVVTLAERAGVPIAAAIFFHGGGHALRPLLGRGGARRLPALRSLLLPGHRVLHRATGSRPSIRARRASTSSRAASSRRSRTPPTGSRTRALPRPSVATSSASGPASTSTSLRPRTHLPFQRGAGGRDPLAGTGRPRRTRFPRSTRRCASRTGCCAPAATCREARLLEAYRRGMFPWYSAGPADPVVVARSARGAVPRRIQGLAQPRQDAAATAASRPRFDRAFGDVIGRCADPALRPEGTWITPQMRAAYQRLHAAGFAHSVETWLDGRLVAACTGCALGRVFFGESMFSLERDASKVALQATGRTVRWRWASN